MNESASVANVKSAVRKAALHPEVCSRSYSFWRQERELNATSICALHTTRQGMSQYNSQYPLSPLLNTLFAIHLRTITFLLAPSRSSSWLFFQDVSTQKFSFPQFTCKPNSLSTTLWRRFGEWTTWANIFLFSTASRPLLGPNQHTYQRVRVALSPQMEWQGHATRHSGHLLQRVRMWGGIHPLSHIYS